MRFTHVSYIYIESIFFLEEMFVNRIRGTFSVLIYLHSSGLRVQLVSCARSGKALRVPQDGHEWLERQPLPHALQLSRAAQAVG